MKKIAFYLNHKGLGGVNCSNIINSNPGIGGTSYMFLVICTLLNTRKEKYKISLFMDEPVMGLKGLDIQIVNGIQDAIYKVENEKYDVFIIKHDSAYVTKRLLIFHQQSLSVFVWTHNFINRKELDYYDSLTNVKRVICVSREHRDIFLDHPCIKKTCFIFNTLNTDLSYKKRVQLHPYNQRKRIVTHVGSIVPGKNFHHLAAIWKDIIKEVPDAELYVIGNGLVYDRSMGMGRYGIAQQDYEDMFIPYLLENGKIMPSVHFLGSMGKEKEEVLLETKVGVPNPWGEVYGETFCIVAVEMQLCGVTVVAGKCPGYFDTFFNGKMVDNRLLKDTIVNLLLADDPIMDYDTTYHCIIKNFSNSVILNEWEKLLDSDYHKPLPIPKDIKNFSYRYKWIKYGLAHLKYICPLVKGILPLDTILQKIGK